ncbi:hypothetical protein [Paraburkholderia sp. BR10882]|uniref:hypothetical protein n=1 Tax=unclassified Paraburkholderia TaxID=2615204 RepID=UPI0034CE68B0
MSNTTLRLLPIAAIASVLCACGGSNHNSTPASTSNASTGPYTAGNLLVSRSVYDAGFTVAGQLPNNGNPEGTGTAAAAVTAVTPGGFPNVFTNDANDPNFGVTAEIYLDQWAPGATSAAQTTDITAMARQSGFDFSTSFPSKSELGMNVSLDKSAITFMGYNAPIDQVDISNSNTPGVIDPTNTDVAAPTYRTVAQLNLASNTLSFTRTNAYAGNNGRAAVLANGMYYMVGNAGNSGSNPNPTYGTLDTLTMDTGVQSIVPGSACAFTQVIGAFNTGNGSTYTPAAAGTACSLASLGTITDSLSAQVFSKKTNAGGNQFGFTLASVAGQVFDKTGKDDNLRGLFVDPNGTMYVSKGSGGNGVNTVYQVGAAGALANGGKLPQNASMTIVPGFPTTSAATLTASSATTTPPAWTLSQGVGYPFGMWVPSNNTNLMFVADEGDGGTSAYAPSGSGGLWVYQQSGGTWTAIAHITQGLNLGQPYTITDTAGTYGTAGANYTTTPDGLRNVTGQINSDGSYTLYAVTSTIGNSLGTTFDAGADSNQLVTLKLSVSGQTVTTSGFTVMQTAPYGQVLRGVTLVPAKS